MTALEPHSSRRLVELLETLPAEVRREIMAYLLDRPTGTISPLGNLHESPAPSRLASLLPVGEDSQLVTIRLPADRHGELRTWCAGHGFTMAAVVRGLVEQFLEVQQRRSPPAPPPGVAAGA